MHLVYNLTRYNQGAFASDMTQSGMGWRSVVTAILNDREGLSPMVMITVPLCLSFKSWL